MDKMGGKNHAAAGRGGGYFARLAATAGRLAFGLPR